MQSCIYEGKVYHKRFFPVAHQFQYHVMMLFLDLDELDDVFRGHCLWSSRHPAVAWFRRADHLGDPSKPLAQSVRDLVEEDGRPRPTGAIRLLTHLRYFGFVINPVSFYFCFNEKHCVEAIVAEVHNTPWGEQHCYILGPEHFARLEGGVTTSKLFHVSPFMPMDMQYQWRVTAPADALQVEIGNYNSKGCCFQASLRLHRREISVQSLTRAIIAFPFMTLSVARGIYWQAFLLWLKRAPYFSHPKVRHNTNSH